MCLCVCIWHRVDLEGGAEHIQRRPQASQPLERRRNCGQSSGVLQAVEFEPVLPTLDDYLVLFIIVIIIVVITKKNILYKDTPSWEKHRRKKSRILLQKKDPLEMVAWQKYIFPFWLADKWNRALKTSGSKQRNKNDQ